MIDLGHEPVCVGSPVDRASPPLHNPALVEASARPLQPAAASIKSAMVGRVRGRHGPTAPPVQQAALGQGSDSLLLSVDVTGHARILAHAALCAALLALAGCTPIARHQALVAVGAAGCGAGLAADAAGESWGGLVQASGCWLADWAAARLDTLRAAERTGQPGQLADLDAAAVQLAHARAALLAEPCPVNAEHVADALRECERLSREVQP